MIHVYIDESGSFVPGERLTSKVSGVTALICSGKVVDDLFTEFSRMARSFPTVNGEVKGSRLDEGQVAAVISLLHNYDAMVEAQVIDAGWHKDRDLRAFRMKVADTLGVNALKAQDDQDRKLAGRLQVSVEAMSNQLFMQAWMTLPLVRRVIQTAISYYSLNAPRELAGFIWTVDAKDTQGLTAAEEFWSRFVVPYLDNESRTKPLGLLPDGTHSAMASFINSSPNGETGTLSIHRVLTDHLAFRDSAGEPGLQLVDIVASAITRAFNGTLKEAGWQALPYILGGSEPQVVQYGRMGLKDHGDRRIPICGEHEEVMGRLLGKRRLVYQDGGRQHPVAY